MLSLKKKKEEGPWVEISCDKNQMHKIFLKLQFTYQKKVLFSQGAGTSGAYFKF